MFLLKINLSSSELGLCRCSDLTSCGGVCVEVSPFKLSVIENRVKRWVFLKGRPLLTLGDYF